MTQSDSERVSLDDVWRLFKASQQEADRRNAETEAAIARSRVEADRRHAETEAAIARSRAETDAAFRELSRRMGDISNRLGDFVEDMVVPACEKLFLDRGIPVHRVSRRTKARFDGRSTEFDIIVVNLGHAMAVEVKSRPQIADVDEHVQRLVDFKKYFRELHDYQVLGAIAGMSLDDNVARYAYRQGLFVLGQSGETVVIRNDAKFQPKVW